MFTPAEIMQLIQSMIWLLAGVGIFIVGMNFMSAALEKSAGDGMKRLLGKICGNRFADGDVGDQKRVMTPAAAKEIGSDYIVVGRPITAAADPVAAYERCVAEFVD